MKRIVNIPIPTPIETSGKRDEGTAEPKATVKSEAKVKPEAKPEATSEHHYRIHPRFTIYDITPEDCETVRKMTQWVRPSQVGKNEEWAEQMVAKHKLVRLEND